MLVTKIVRNSTQFYEILEYVCSLLFTKHKATTRLQLYMKNVGNCGQFENQVLNTKKQYLNKINDSDHFELITGLFLKLK